MRRGPGSARSQSGRQSRRQAWQVGGLFALAAALASGCDVGGTEASTGASASLISGMPRCDASLLHPRITVGGAASAPGKLIVYVDGVMACVDDAGKVDQVLSQMEGRSLGSSMTPPSDELKSIRK